MKIDIHDIEGDLLERAARDGGVIETTVVGTDGRRHACLCHDAADEAASGEALTFDVSPRARLRVPLIALRTTAITFGSAQCATLKRMYACGRL